MPSGKDEGKEENQINWEKALHDVMDITCNYLTLKELCIVAQVNKSWRKAALCEKSKRLYIQQLRLFYNDYGTLPNKLHVNPSVTLLIYDCKLEKQLSLPIDAISDLYSNGLEEELLLDLKQKVPNELLVLRVDEILTSRDVQLRMKVDQCELETTDYCSMQALFFPSVTRRAQIKMASILHFQHYDPGIAAEHLVEELGLNDSEYSNSTLLLFFDIRDYFAPKIISDLYKRVQKSGDLTWMSVFGSKLGVGGCGSNYYWGSRHTIVALRIFGPSIKSWSTFIHYNSEDDEIERKLLELRERVTAPARRCTGLMYAVKCNEEGCSHHEHPCANSLEMMLYLERIFPCVPFVGLFEEDCLDQLPLIDCQIMDRIVAGQNKDWFAGSMLRTFASIMIISYGD